MIRTIAVGLFSSIYSLLRAVRKIFIVATVLSAAISLFFFFSGGGVKKINPTLLIEHNRNQIYSQIESFKEDTSPEGALKLAIYQGWICTSVGEACSEKPSDGNINFQGSLFGKMSGWMGVPYANPPASGIAWVGSSLEHAGFIPKTYAATGAGFASIQSYMGIWKLFRDIAYLILVIMMIVIGFMIMFRSSIGGQTVVNIENSLPRIIIALIMITFSFPLAGLLIDLMYAMIAISVGLLYDVGNIAQYASQDATTWYGKSSSEQALAEYMTAGFTELWPDGGGTFFGVGMALWKLLPSVIQTFSHVLLVPLSILYTSSLLKPLADTTKTFSMATILGNGWGNLIHGTHNLAFYAGIIFFIIWGPGLIFGLIIILTVLVFMFKLFFMLISSYIKIILYIVFSPIILLFSAFPGNGNIGWWFRNMLGELSVFPTIIIVMLVGNAIMAVNTNGVEWSGAAGLPLVSGTEQSFRLPFLYGFQTEEFNTIIALGIVLLIPDFIKLVKGVIGVGESKLNLGLGTFFAGAGMFMSGLGTASSLEGYKSALTGGSMYKPKKGLLHWIGAGALADTINKKSELPDASSS